MWALFPCRLRVHAADGPTRQLWTGAAFPRNCLFVIVEERPLSLEHQRPARWRYPAHPGRVHPERLLRILRRCWLRQQLTQCLWWLHHRRIETYCTVSELIDRRIGIVLHTHTHTHTHTPPNMERSWMVGNYTTPTCSIILDATDAGKTVAHAKSHPTFRASPRFGGETWKQPSFAFALKQGCT